MVICEDLVFNKKISNSVITIGCFDGMHIGHTRNLDKVKEVSKKNKLPSVVVTFNPNPKFVLNKNNSTNYNLLSKTDFIDILKTYAIDYLWIIPFNLKFAKISADKFLFNLVSYFKPKSLIIGYDHHFGYQKEGNRNFLEKNKIKYNYSIYSTKPVIFNKKPISSSRIRKFIENKDIENANISLGRKYQISGKVIRGNQIGNKLGYPTANIKPNDEKLLIPGNGVYCVESIIDDKRFVGICNIGFRPTIDANNNNVTIEVHFITDIYLNLYDKNIDIIFNNFIRCENKYNSKKELIKQITLDKQNCMTL